MAAEVLGASGLPARPRHTPLRCPGRGGTTHMGSPGLRLPHGLARFSRAGLPVGTSPPSGLDGVFVTGARLRVCVWVDRHLLHITFVMRSQRMQAPQLTPFCPWGRGLDLGFTGRKRCDPRARRQSGLRVEGGTALCLCLDASREANSPPSAAHGLDTGPPSSGLGLHQRRLERAWRQVENGVTAGELGAVEGSAVQRCPGG